MYGERSKADADNYVRRMLDVQDGRLKQDAYDFEVKDRLADEITRFNAFKRAKRL